MRWLPWSAVLIVCLVAGCSSKPTKPVALTMLAPKETLTVTLPDFPKDGTVPDQYSDYGPNETPTVQWSKPPTGTESLLLLVEDPDAPTEKPYVHYLVFNIPPTATQIGKDIPSLAKLGANTHGESIYFGPRPASGTHRYHFQVLALSTALGEDSGATWDAIRPKVEGFVLAGGEAIATYTKH